MLLLLSGVSASVCLPVCGVHHEDEKITKSSWTKESKSIFEPPKDLVLVIITFVWTQIKGVFSCPPPAYSIQGQSVQIISSSSESHQQVVAVGQPLTVQPQGTVVVRDLYTTLLQQHN